MRLEGEGNCARLCLPGSTDSPCKAIKRQITSALQVHPSVTGQF